MVKHLKSYTYTNETFQLGEIVHYINPDLDTDTFGMIEDITEFKWHDETEKSYFIEVRPLYDDNGYSLSDCDKVTLSIKFIQKAEPFIKDVIKELKQNIKALQSITKINKSKEAI